jgi:hypothetical protein
MEAKARGRLRSALDAAQTGIEYGRTSKALAVPHQGGLTTPGGDAALRAAKPQAQRFGLTDVVPCRGTDRNRAARF